MSRPILISAAAALILAGCGVRAPAPVETRIEPCPAAAPSVTCPDLPGLPQPATVEDLVQAWIAIGPVHVACREALAVWRKAWTACDQPESR